MNPAPTYSGALWSGNQQLATKRQLISSIQGVYADIQDINLSTVVVNNIFASTGQVQYLGVSTLSFKGFDSLLDLDVSFDLGLGDAVGGLLGGIGALVGGTAIGLGTGVGLGLQGLTTGLFSLANTRGDTFLNSNVFETVNGTSQLQISTLGNAYPLYSTIYRSVSSFSPNTQPGPEILLSSFFQPGTTCIRTVSDPLSLITSDSNVNTSTLQSYGQWVPFLDPTPTGEDIFARNATFSTLVLNAPGPGTLASAVYASNAGGADVAYWGEATNQPTFYSYPFTSNNATIANSPAVYYPFNHNWYANTTLNFISTTYSPYTSTIGNYIGGVYFITSSITDTLSTIPQFTYTGTGIGGGNFAICEEDESNFLSTATMDFIAQSSNILVQWGLAVDNRNSTIGVGTGKRVSWNNTTNTSNFIDIPVAQSTIVNNFATFFSIKQHPLETELNVVASPDTGLGGQGAMNFNITRAVFGGNTTAFNNQPGYPYQFNGNVFINGNLEADTLIAISSIINVSTNLQTFFSTQTFDADLATISSAFVNQGFFSNLTASNAFVSSLQTNFIGGDGISSFGIEVYNSLSQFSYVSTLVVDYQIYGNLTPGVKCYLQEIIGSNGAYIQTDNADFQNLSTINLSTINLSASNAEIYNLSSFSGVFYNATVIETLNGSNYFGQNMTLSTLTTSTLNVNTISTSSHTGSEIICDDITINNFATFPSVGSNSNVITMTFSNNTNSNSYVPFTATLIQGSVFPQTSNQFKIQTTGSNTRITDRQQLVFDTVIGNTVSFGAGVDILQQQSGDFYTRSVKYGTSASQYLQPRAFGQSNSVNMNDDTNVTVYAQVTDGTNTFLVSQYNFIPCMMGFNVQNTAIAVNEVSVRPYNSNGYWWVRLDVYVNALPGNNDMNWYWNNLLFPYNMMT